MKVNITGTICDVVGTDFDDEALHWLTLTLKLLPVGASIVITKTAI